MFGDYYIYPPEVHSVRLNGGPKQGSLISAAMAWQGLHAKYLAALHQLTAAVNSAPSGIWQGESGLSFTQSFVPMYAWLENSAAKAGINAGAHTEAAAAFTTAEATMPTMSELISNHVTHAILVATNFLGINTVPIMLNEADYARMWVQAATTMEAYEASTSSALASVPETPPTVMLVAGDDNTAGSEQNNVWGADHGGQDDDSSSHTHGGIPNNINDISQQMLHNAEKNFPDWDGADFEGSPAEGANILHNAMSEAGIDTPEAFRAELSKLGFPDWFVKFAPVRLMMNLMPVFLLGEGSADVMVAATIMHEISHIGGLFVNIAIASMTATVAATTAVPALGVAAVAGATAALPAGVLGGLSGLAGLAGLGTSVQVPPLPTDIKPAMVPPVPPATPAMPAVSVSSPSSPPAPPAAPAHLGTTPPPNQGPTPPAGPGPGGTPVAPHFNATMPAYGYAMMATALSNSIYSTGSHDADSDADDITNLGDDFTTSDSSEADNTVETAMPLNMGWMGVETKNNIGKPAGFQLLEDDEFTVSRSSPLLPGTWSAPEQHQGPRIALLSEDQAQVFDNTGNSMRVSFSAQSGQVSTVKNQTKDHTGTTLRYNTD